MISRAVLIGLSAVLAGCTQQLSGEIILTCEHMTGGWSSTRCNIRPLPDDADYASTTVCPSDVCEPPLIPPLYPVRKKAEVAVTRESGSVFHFVRPGKPSIAIFHKDGYTTTIDCITGQGFSDCPHDQLRIFQSHQ